MEGNGENTTCIVVKCIYDVYPDEWEILSVIINQAISEYKEGDFRNVLAVISNVPSELT